MKPEKEIRRIGSAYDDLLAFPDKPRRAAGFQLSRVQAGLEPEDWRAFDAVGAGTREIRIRESSGIYWVMYVAKLRKPYISCTAFRKRHRQPASGIRILRRHAIVLSSI